MTREEAIEYWEGLRKTFSSQLEKEENHFGRMHLQTTIEALDMAISALRQQEAATDRHQMTNADRIRAMSDEELAVFLIDLADDGNLKIREWLQQPAEEDDHE